MEKAESKSRAGTAAAAPEMEVKTAVAGFLSEFNAFQSEIKAKLQE